MTKLKVKKAFKEVMKEVADGKPVTRTAGMILREVGYSPSTAANPGRVFSGADFQKLLARVDDEIIVGRICEIMMGEDTRSSLSAAETLLRLKDRFPAGKLKVQAYSESVGGLRDEES